MTQSGGRFLGTYRYAAPEYILDDTYDYRSDLYSFGAVLYFLLHGKEIWHVYKRTPDIIRAKEEHFISFDETLRGKGPVWDSLFDLCEALLAREPDQRPANALACLDRLAGKIPSMIPLRVYFACSLTRIDERRQQQAERVGCMLRECAQSRGFSVYLPGEHTHPLGAPDLSSPEVYWIDRERVASSDLLCVYADDPSHGVGQEAEIAGNAGVPLLFLYSRGSSVSRMLRGTAGRILEEIAFSTEEDLQSRVGAFFEANRARLRLSRRAREREYNLRLANRLKALRRERGLSIEELANRAELAKELIESVESRPERLAALSTLQLRSIARALEIVPAELLRDQSTRDQEFEDIYRESLAELRQFARDRSLAYASYEELKAHGRELLRDEFDKEAARGRRAGVLTISDWRDVYKRTLDDASSSRRRGDES